MRPVELFCWHFMAYPYLPDDFDEQYESGWVTVPNRLWDRERTDGLYQEYIDQLVYAEELGFDGLVLNEHHQNIYGLMPSPNIIAAALTQRTKRGKIVVLGSLLPLHLNPLRVAEEYAMVEFDERRPSHRRLRHGRRPRGLQLQHPAAAGARAAIGRRSISSQRAWTEDGPFRHEGPHYPLRYVNVWPKPRQVPHPPIWIPGALSLETMEGVAKRGYDYFLSSRTHGAATRLAAQRFAGIIKQHGGNLSSVPHGHPSVGLCCRDRRAGARRGARGRVVLPQILPQGASAARGPAVDRGRGRALDLGPVLRELSQERDARRQAAGRRRKLGRARRRRLDHRRQPQDRARETVGARSSRRASAICSSSSISATCAPTLRAKACGSSRPRSRRRCGADSAALFARDYPELADAPVAGAAE